MASDGARTRPKSLRCSTTTRSAQVRRPHSVRGRVSPRQPQVHAGANPTNVPRAHRVTSVQASLNKPSRYCPATYPQWPAMSGPPTRPLTITETYCGIGFTTEPTTNVNHRTVAPGGAKKPTNGTCASKYVSHETRFAAAINGCSPRPTRWPQHPYTSERRRPNTVPGNQQPAQPSPGAKLAVTQPCGPRRTGVAPASLTRSVHDRGSAPPQRSFTRCSESR